MKNLFRIILAGTLFAGFAGALWGDIGFSGGSAGAAGSGDIEGVLAGGGLAGGGTSGTPTLTVASTMSITGGQFDVGRSTLAVSLGKVGIGKSNPSYSLDVNGDMAVRDAFRVGLSTFYVTSSGNGIVGIGNTSPLLSLDISHGVSGSAGISIQNLTASGNSQIKLLDNSGNNVFDLAYGNGTSATHPEELYLTIPKGKLGIGTTTPSYWMHISTAAGERGTIFAVSSGTVDLFRVLGTSVNFKVPLVFPDGTTQASAAAAGTGDIEGVLAGGGLAGGGTSGTPTLTLASTVSVTGSGFDVGGSTLVVAGGKIGIGTTNPANSFDVFTTTFIIDRGKVGVGTNSPTRVLHVNQNQGTTGSIFSVSTGTTHLFEVGGTSVQTRVPIVFQDGTSLNSATGVQSQWTTNGSNIGYAGGKVGIGTTAPNASVQIATAAGTTTKIFAASTGTVDIFAVHGASVSFTVPAYFYGDIFMSGTGSAVISGTNTVNLDAATSRWEFAPSTLTYRSSNGVKYLIARATHSLTVNMSSDTTNGFASRDEVFKTPPAGETWTLTKAWGHSLPSGATVQFNIGIYTSSGAYSGNSVFTITHASATVNGTFQTSGVVASGMANPTLQAGQYWGIRCPATGHAGGPNRLIVNLEYLRQ